MSTVADDFYEDDYPQERVEMDDLDWFELEGPLPTELSQIELDEVLQFNAAADDEFEPELRTARIETNAAWLLRRLERGEEVAADDTMRKDYEGLIEATRLHHLARYASDLVHRIERADQFVQAYLHLNTLELLTSQLMWIHGAGTHLNVESDELAAWNSQVGEVMHRMAWLDSRAKERAMTCVRHGSACVPKSAVQLDQQYKRTIEVDSPNAFLQL